VLGPYCLRVSLERETQVETDMDNAKHRHHRTFAALCKELSADSELRTTVRARKLRWAGATDSEKRRMLLTLVSDVRYFREAQEAQNVSYETLTNSISRVLTPDFAQKAFSLSEEEAVQRSLDLLVKAENYRNVLEGKTLQNLRKDVKTKTFPEAEKGLAKLLPLLTQAYADSVLELGLVLCRAGGMTPDLYEKQISSANEAIKNKLIEMGVLEDGAEPNLEALRATLAQLAKEGR